MNSKVKQAIIDRLRATKRENIESVIKYMEEQGFFSYHCHHHHHYKVDWLTMRGKLIRLP